MVVSLFCGALCSPGNRCKPWLPPGLVGAASPCRLERNLCVNGIRSTPVHLSLRITKALGLHEDHRAHLLQVTHMNCYTCQKNPKSFLGEFFSFLLFLRFSPLIEKSQKWNTLSSLPCPVPSHVDFSANTIESRQNTLRFVWTVAQNLDFLLKDICIWAPASSGKGASVSCLRLLLCGGVLNQGDIRTGSQIYLCLRLCSCCILWKGRQV